MKKIRKLLILFIVFSMLFSIPFIVGCSCSQPCTMEELIGTYKLTNYERKYEPEEEGGEKTVENFLENKGIEMYLVVTGTESGYLSYKDKDSELIVREIKILYNYQVNEEGVTTDLISTIEYSTNVGTKYEAPQDGWSNMGTTGKGKYLNNNNPKYEGFFKNLLYRDYLDFEKVSSKIDLSYIQEQYGTLPQAETLSAI